MAKRSRRIIFRLRSIEVGLTFRQFDVVREERSPIELPVSGRIPSYAAGTIYRNGPGARQIFDNNGVLKFEVSHWFDGLAQLHKFDLVAGSDGIDTSSTGPDSRSIP